MNHVERLILKAKRQVLRETNARYPLTMTAVPETEWPQALADLMESKPVKVWRSRHFLAVLYQEPRKVNLRLSVSRTTLRDDGRFMDGITWDELQSVKSECGYGDCDAVELYPRDCDVVNVSNMRHLWLLPGLAPFAWRSE